MKTFYLICASILALGFTWLLRDNHLDAVRYVNKIEKQCLSESETSAMCTCLKNKMYPEKAAWIPSTANHWAAKNVIDMMKRRCKRGV